MKKSIYLCLIMSIFIISFSVFAEEKANTKNDTTFVNVIDFKNGRFSPDIELAIDYKDGKFNLFTRSQTVGKIFKEIEAKAKIEIKVDDETAQKKVSIFISNKTLKEGIEAILNNIGQRDLAISYKEVGGGSPPKVDPPLADKPAQFEITKVEIRRRNKEEIEKIGEEKRIKRIEKAIDFIVNDKEFVRDLDLGDLVRREREYVVPYLIPILENHPKDELRSLVALLLPKCSKSPLVIPALIKASNDRSPLVRKSIAESLFELKQEKEAVDVVIGLLNEGEDFAYGGVINLKNEDYKKKVFDTLEKIINNNANSITHRSFAMSLMVFIYDQPLTEDYKKTIINAIEYVEQSQDYVDSIRVSETIDNIGSYYLGRKSGKREEARKQMRKLKKEDNFILNISEKAKNSKHKRIKQDAEDILKELGIANE